jgi:hypothetical protein
LGVEVFAEGLRRLITEKQRIREIPKGQRFAGQPTLEKLFAQRTSDKTTRDQLIEKAVSECGYSEMELASFLDLHYSTISRISHSSRSCFRIALFVSSHDVRPGQSKENFHLI